MPLTEGDGMEKQIRVLVAKSFRDHKRHCVCIRCIQRQVSSRCGPWHQVLGDLNLLRSVIEASEEAILGVIREIATLKREVS